MYNVTIGSRVSQFGKTIITCNLVDDAGVMPNRTVLYKCQSESPTNAELLAARNDVKQNATQEYTDTLTASADLDAFRQWLDNKLDTRCQGVIDQIQTLILASNLTARQKAIGNRIIVDWRLS